jgi:hypothetical protein
MKQKKKLIICYEQNKARANSVKGIVQRQLTGVANEINWVGRPLKGSVTRFFILVFLIKQLHLVPLDIPRKDFEFFRIFDELLVFTIDSGVRP